MHLMVDIETLGTNSHAPVIQIGAILFDEYNTYAGFNRDVLPNFQRSTPDVSTLCFWQKQDITMPLNEDASELPKVIRDLAGWLENIEIEGVWANDPAFDLVILRTLADAYGIDLPWTHRQHRCCRTMFKHGKKLGVPRLKSEILHDALADARAQSETIIMINSHLAEKGVAFL